MNVSRIDYELNNERTLLVLGCYLYHYYNLASCRARIQTASTQAIHHLQLSDCRSNALRTFARACR